MRRSSFELSGQVLVVHITIFWVLYIPMLGAGSLFPSSLPLFSLQLLRDIQRALGLSEPSVAHAVPGQSFLAVEWKLVAVFVCHELGISKNWTTKHDMFRVFLCVVLLAASILVPRNSKIFQLRTGGTGAEVRAWVDSWWCEDGELCSFIPKKLQLYESTPILNHFYRWRLFLVNMSTNSW